MLLFPSFFLSSALSGHHSPAHPWHMKLLLPFGHQVCAYGGHISRIHWLLAGDADGGCLFPTLILFILVALCGSGQMNS